MMKGIALCVRPSCCVLQIYEGKVDPWVMSDNCTDNVPILIRRATFCSAFAADARDFRQYNSWVRPTHTSHSAEGLLVEMWESLSRC